MPTTSTTTRRHARTARVATLLAAAAAALAASSIGLDTPRAAAADPGDTFASPTSIGGAHGGIRLSNTGATGEPGEPPHFITSDGGGDKPDHSIWFSWRAPSTGRVTFRTKDSTFDTVLAAYAGSSLQSLIRLDDDDDTPFPHTGDGHQSQVTFTATRGTTYRIAVDSFTGTLVPNLVPTGRVRLSWDANDDFGAPIALPASSSDRLLAFSDTNGATRQSDEPVHLQLKTAPAGSTWFTWTAPKSGTARFSVGGSLQKAGFAVYTGSSLTSLTPVGAAFIGDPLTNGSATFSATAGTTYRIAVTSAGAGEAGEAVLSYGYA